MPRLAALASLALVAGTLATPMSGAQPGSADPAAPGIRTYAVAEGGPDVRILGIPDRDTLERGEARPDMRLFWQRIDARDPEGARVLLRRWGRAFPGWTAPLEAAAELDKLEVETGIAVAAAAGDWSEILDIAEGSPGWFDGCLRPDLLWPLTDALAALGEEARLVDRYAGMLDACPEDRDRLYVLERALVQLPTHRTVSLFGTVDVDTLADAQRQDYAAMGQRLRARQVSDALQAGNLGRAARLALSAESAGLALDIAWRFHDSGDFETAAAWFDRAIAWGERGEVQDAHFGSAVTMLDRQEVDAARRHIAALDAADPRRAELLARLKAMTPATRGTEPAFVSPSQAEIAAAWNLLEAGRPVQALARFDHAIALGAGDEARYGAALAAEAAGQWSDAEDYLAGIREPSPNSRALAGRLKLAAADRALGAGDTDVAVALAREAATLDPEAADRADALIAGATLRQADAAYRAGAYESAIALARTAAEHPGVAAEAQTIEGWSLYQSGAFDEAAEAFGALYSHTASEEAAKGLFYSLMAAEGGEARLRRLAAAEPAGAPLAEQVRLLDGRQAFERNDFHQAAQFASEEFSELGGIGNPWFAQTIGFRFDGDEPGRDRFEALVGRTAVGWSRGRHIFVSDIREFLVDIGAPSQGDPVGTPGLSFARSPTDGAALVAPRLAWRYEGRWSPRLSLGTTPIGGAVDPLPTVSAGLRFDDGRIRFDGELFLRERADSLLSLAGMRDPATGKTWGRVVEGGLAVSAAVPLGERLTLTGEGLATLLDGQDVVDNDRLRLGAGIGYDLGLDGFEYISVGPSWSWERYARNSNFFTFGHGGYFSPQSFHRVALNLNFQTEEARDWILRGDLSVGHEWIDEDPARVLPFDRGGGLTGGSSTSGFGGSARLQLAWRASDMVMLGGFVDATVSEGYDTLVAGLTVRVTPGGRASVVSTDLTPDPRDLGRR